MLNNEVTFLERERDLLEHRLRIARSDRQRPVYTPVSPPYSPSRPRDFSPTPSPRFSPDPPPAEWETRVTTPEAPQPPTRTAARVLFPDEPEDEEIAEFVQPLRDLERIFGSDSDSDSDSDVEVREVVQRAETAPTAPAPRRRGPCRCTLCGEIGHQRNNRRYHPNN